MMGLEQARPVSGDLITLPITGLGQGGEGLGRHQGLVVFVSGAVPGDQAEVRITEVKKRYARGQLERLLVASPDRVAPPCGLFGTCGGCQLQHLSYPAQLRWKEQLVRDAIARIGGLDASLVRPILAAADPWRYRNKLQAPVAIGL
jgi:23S rRNA (uracil1939-C5)-methyltransferase